MMERKIELMARSQDLSFTLVRPSNWEDEYGDKRPAKTSQKYRTVSIPMIGKTNDPHRAFYGTFTFAAPSTKPNIVHAEEEPESLAALQIALAVRTLAPRAKLVFHTWQNMNRPKKRFVLFVARTSFRCANAILCANSEARKVLAEMGYAGITAVIPPQGVDLTVFRPPSSLVEEPRDGVTIGYVGRFVKEKGLDTLLEAIHTLNTSVKVKLLLIGGGRYRNNLEEQIRSLKLSNQVEFIAPVPPEKLPGFLSRVHALVLPSRTTTVWKEQFGRVLIEAMACKVPVVGSNSGAIPEVIGDAGLIFEEGNPASLATCIKGLAESASFRRELSEKGYMRAKNLYSQEIVAEQTVDFYRKLMDVKIA
jgi:glycosyltransferase involved in cell wall biosynthesis